MAFDALFDVPGSLRAVCLLRTTLGPIVLIHLWPFVQEMGRGRYYADSFYLPWFQGFPDLPRAAYFALLTLCLGTSVLVSLGLWTRLVVAYTAVFVTYNFFASQTHFRHNRSFLVLVLCTLALMPCGKLFSLDAWRRQRSPRGANAHSVPALFERRVDATASLWPMYLLRFEVVCVYAASGVSKLLNVDWRDGTVNLERVLWYQGALRQAGVPELVVGWLTQRGFHAVFSKMAIATELCVAVGLIFQRTRYAALWLAVVFHFVIGVALKVQIFSYLAIAALVIWVTPRCFERTLLVDASSASAVKFALWVRRLDWMGRFRFEPFIATTSAPPSTDAHPLTLIEPNGRRFTGKTARRLALLRCPALFFVLLPVAFKAWLRSRSRAEHP